MRGLLLLGLLLAAPRAQGQYYESHREVSLLGGLGLGYSDVIRSKRGATGVAGVLELGGSLTVGDDRNEVFLLTRGVLGPSGSEGVLLGGYRSFFGDEDWQSFVDLGASLRLFSGTWVGPRLGFGARHTLSDHLSLYGGFGLSLGFGSGLRWDAEAFTGLQWHFPISSR
ncbi:hypothetical protein POL68_04985 [Stigmatella sp. ncwal1]|uniref:Outer membrane protein beta-barrel domain-containing protein n=1 Tax=Stigmatella ashevillensis TaxID=2995309 RepID=A0ABT5D2B8_9BACT|nr:hypothetical protein [Stigmatella ashevillena]MDC0707817.1 hypothetical protein [Stigmatella ashevillena]